MNIRNQNINPDDEELSLTDLPQVCAECGKFLCLRKQVINLALGNTEQLFCLLCLGKINKQNPEELLFNLKTYISGRQCFQKEWDKYKDEKDCPDRYGCFFTTCFLD